MYGGNFYFATSVTLNINVIAKMCYAVRRNFFVLSYMVRFLEPT